MHKNDKYMNRRQTMGFTLLEIMVVVAIIGILIAAIAPNIIGRSDEAKVVKAKQDVRILESALELYRLDNGFYPSNEQALQALVQQPTTPPIPTRWKQGGYIKRLPLDPWGSPYQYANPGSHEAIDIFSYGSDGQTGGDGINGEIGNWN